MQVGALCVSISLGQLTYRQFQKLQLSDRGVLWSIHLSVWVCNNQRRTGLEEMVVFEEKKGQKAGEA